MNTVKAELYIVLYYRSSQFKISRITTNTMNKNNVFDANPTYLVKIQLYLVTQFQDNS